MHCVGRLRKRCLVSAGAPLLTLSLLTGPAENSRVRARAFPLRHSASAPGCGFNRRPPPPNNSFKPTPCRGVGCVLYATLARIRRPATGRLNSGVMRGLAAGCAGSLQLQLHQSSRCSAAKHSSHWSVQCSRRSPSGETALQRVARSGKFSLDVAVRTGLSAPRTGSALGFGGQSWPQTVLAPDSVYRLPTACANKSWRHCCFAGLRVVA